MTPQERHGVLWGALGVASFSLTLPATRAAVAHLDVGFVAIGRGLGAGLLAAVILWTTRQPVPRRSDLFSLCGVAAGVVIGFPFLTTLAMVHVPAAHGAIVVGLLPLSTAVAGVALIGAVVSAAFGYALGGRLATRLGGWQVICWALVVSLPFLALAALVLVEWPRASVPWSAWAGFAYVTLVSQLLGFFAWYHGLAIGGIARVSQTQLLQLFMTLAASAVLLGERLDPRMLTYGAAIVAIVAAGTRVRVNRGLHPARESKSRSSP